MGKTKPDDQKADCYITICIKRRQKDLIPTLINHCSTTSEKLSVSRLIGDMLEIYAELMSNPSEDVSVVKTENKDLRAQNSKLKMEVSSLNRRITDLTKQQVHETSKLDANSIWLWMKENKSDAWAICERAQREFIEE